MTPLILVSDVNQTQTQLRIANVSDQTHIRHIDRGILPVGYDKATAGSDNIKRCKILTPLIPVSDVGQTQTQLEKQMFFIKLILGISTEGYYQSSMTKPQLDLRTLNDVNFLLLSYRFRTLIKLKLNSKLQMFPIKLILGILNEGYYQFDMTKPQLDLRTSNDVKF